MVQGAPFSAELFARVVDSHLGPTHVRWLEEPTWLKSLFLVMYAGDFALLALAVLR